MWQGDVGFAIWQGDATVSSVSLLADTEDKCKWREALGSGERKNLESYEQKYG